jgi:hypothetical protein
VSDALDDNVDGTPSHITVGATPGHNTLGKTPSDNTAGEPPRDRSTRWLLGAVTGLLVVAVAWDESGLGLWSRAWAAVITVVLAVVIADVLPAARNLAPTRTILPLTLGAAALAAYAAVPETDPFRGVVVVVGLAVAIDVVARVPLPLSGIGLASALVLWAGVDGSAGRQSALVAALFASWTLLLLPLTAALRSRTRDVAEPVRWLVSAIGAAAALIVARTGGLEPTAGRAIVAAAIAAPVSLLVAIATVEIAANLSARPAPRQP